MRKLKLGLHLTKTKLFHMFQMHARLGGGGDRLPFDFKSLDLHAFDTTRVVVADEDRVRAGSLGEFYISEDDIANQAALVFVAR